MRDFKTLQVWETAHALTLLVLLAAALIFPSITTFGQDEPPPEIQPEFVWSLAWSHDGRTIAAGIGPGQCNQASRYGITLFDVTSDYRPSRLGFSFCSIDNLDWNPDDHYIIGSGLGEPVAVWDVTTGYGVASFGTLTPYGFIDSLWDFAGERIVSIEDADPYVRIWNPVNGQELFIFSAHSPTSVDWSPDGNRLVTAREDILIWDAATGNLLFHFETGELDYITWSPDGRKLAGAVVDNTVRVWDAATGAALFVMEGHTDTIRDVVWSPDGNQLASISDDGTLRIWDSNNGGQLAWIQHETGLVAVDWSPSGRQLVYGDLYSPSVYITSLTTCDTSNSEMSLCFVDSFALNPSTTSTPIP